MKKVLIRLITTVIILIAAIYTVMYFFGDSNKNNAFEILNDYESSSEQLKLIDNLGLLLNTSNEDAKDEEILAYSTLMGQLIGSSFELNSNTCAGLSVKLNESSDYYYAFLLSAENEKEEDIEKLNELAKSYVSASKQTNDELETFWTYFNLSSSTASAVEDRYAEVRQAYYKQLIAQLKLAVGLSDYVHEYVFVSDQNGYFSNQDEMYRKALEIYAQETIDYVSHCIENNTDINSAQNIYTSSEITNSNFTLTSFITAINGR